MLKPVEHGNGDDFPLALFLSADSPSRRDLLINALMWPCPVEERNVFFEHSIQLPVAQDQQVIETFALHTAQKSLTDGVRPRRTIGSSQALNPRGLGYRRELGTEFAMVVADQVSF